MDRTDRLPADLIVNSQGTEIFSQELPRVCVSSGADPGFFLGGGAPLTNDVTDR